MKKIAFLDLETTSLDERTGETWEIGLILRDFTQTEVQDEEWWWRVRPDLTHADPMALQVGRYYERSRVGAGPVGSGKRLSPSVERPSDARWIHRVSGDLAESYYYIEENARRIAARLARMLDGATIVANNPAFDRKFGAKFLRDNGQALTASHRMIDVRPLAMGYVLGLAKHHPVDEVFSGDAAQYVYDWLDGDTDHLDWRALGVHQDPATSHTALGDARLVRDVFDAIGGRIA